MLHRFMLTTVASLGISSAAMAADLSNASWEEVITQAKAEGEVTWFQWYFEDRFRETVAVFEKKYGITVVLPDLDGGDTGLNKLLAEAGRDAGDIDVVSVPGSRAPSIDAATYLMGPLLPMLPEADQLTDKAEGGDWEQYGIKFWGNQTGIAYNSARSDVESLPKTFSELESWMELNPGALGFNFENGGSGPSLIHNIARNILSIDADTVVAEKPDLTPVFDWFTAREDQYVLTTSNNDSYARLNDGEFTIVAVWEDGIAGLIESGEINKDIKVYIPDWGMNGGGNVVAIPANAPNPAAALLFVSWLTSAETQTQLNVKFGSAPANKNADDKFALIPNVQRANSTNWGEPLPSDSVLPAVIENVFQK